MRILANIRRGPGGAVLLVLGLVSTVLLPGCAGQAAGRPQAWYAAHNGVPPRLHRIYVCHAFGCALKTPVDFSKRDLSRLRQILAAGRANPEAERRAIARAVAWNEKRVAPLVGSENDVGGLDLANAGVPGQMDCIDEATNTTSLLLVAEENGLLRHHRVTTPVARGYFLDGRYPHATAVVVERESGAAHAVDSWPQANGELPTVMPLDDWFAASAAG